MVCHVLRVPRASCAKPLARAEVCHLFQVVARPRQGSGLVGALRLARGGGHRGPQRRHACGDPRGWAGHRQAGEEPPAPVEDRRGHRGGAIVELPHGDDDALTPDSIELGLEARRAHGIQQARPLAGLQERGEDLARRAPVHRPAPEQRVGQAHRVALGLDDVEHDRLQRTRRGEDHRLPHLLRQLLHHLRRRLHQPLAQPRLRAAPQCHQPRAQSDRAVGPALDEAVLLEFGQEPIGGAGRHSRLGGQRGHGWTGRLLTEVMQQFHGALQGTGGQLDQIPGGACAESAGRAPATRATRRASPPSPTSCASPSTSAFHSVSSDSVRAYSRTSA